MIYAKKTAAILIAVSILSSLGCKEQPTYQGEPRSHWIDMLDDNDWRTKAKAREALLSMVTYRAGDPAAEALIESTRGMLDGQSRDAVRAKLDRLSGLGYEDPVGMRDGVRTYRGESVAELASRVPSETVEYPDGESSIRGLRWFVLSESDLSAFVALMKYCQMNPEGKFEKSCELLRVHLSHEQRQELAARLASSP